MPAWVTPPSIRRAMFGVVQRRQHAPFTQEQTLLQFRIQAAPQQFHRGLLAEILAAAFTEENGRHAALTERTQDAEFADLLADQAFRFGDVFRRKPHRVFAGRRVEEAAAQSSAESRRNKAARSSVSGTFASSHAARSGSGNSTNVSNCSRRRTCA